MLDGGRHVGRTGERRLAGEHLEEHHAEGVQIGPGVGFEALDLLRAEIPGRAEDRPGPGQVGTESFRRFGDTEVGDLYPWHLTSLAPIKQHVARLDVPVYEAVGVGVGERIGDLAADAGGQPRRHRPPIDQALAQRLAADELHDDEGGPGSGHAGVVGGHHVRVREAGGGHRLLLEAVEEALVAGEVGVEDLDGDRPGQDLVVAFPHRRHAALCHQPDQPVPATEPAVRVERRRRVRDSHGTEGYPPTGPASEQGNTPMIKPPTKTTPGR